MWTRWHWDRDFPSTSLISCQYHCTNPFACRYNANCVVNQAQPHSLLKVLQANCQCLYKPFWQLSARQKNIGLCFLPASAINLTRTRITVHSFPQALLDDPHCADEPHSHYNLYPQVCQSVAREGEARSRPTSWRTVPALSPHHYTDWYTENAKMGSVAGLCPSKMKAPRREPYRRQYSVTCQRTGINQLLWHLSPNLQTVREAPRRPRCVAWIWTRKKLQSTCVTTINRTVWSRTLVPRLSRADRFH